ncbi:flagellar hook-length control protein FliK [Thermithiobacillus plumbiphilus]|uniref:Flagellar hook-length control protein FliK n=1 Tax=Thermithiobacillus plumbiphilus TaxID=1729899 RepID=A0ABU9DAK5_9PROT
MNPVSIKAPNMPAQDAKTPAAQPDSKHAGAQDVFRMLMAGFGAQALAPEALNLAGKAGQDLRNADGEALPEAGLDADEDGKDLPQGDALVDFAMLGLPLHQPQLLAGNAVSGKADVSRGGQVAVAGAGQDLDMSGETGLVTTRTSLAGAEDFSALLQAGLPDKVSSVETGNQPLPPVSLNLNQQSQALAARVPVDAGNLPVPVGTPEWSQGLEQKVVWMFGRQEQNATLQLNPPQLGPLEIHLHIKDDQATALFVSPHGAVREAIEAAMPRLRESFQDQGINLAGSCLSQNAAEQFARREDNGRQPASWGGQQTDALADAEHGVSIQGGPATRGEGLVNLFA